MKTGAELYLWKTAQLLTALVLLQLVWSGARLLLMSDPEPLVPAESSLQVGEIRYDTGLDRDTAPNLVARPLFWPGRQPYTPTLSLESVVQTDSRASGSINDVELLGVYAAAQQSPGIIVAYKGERRRLRQGDLLEDWKFVLLRDNEATFESGKERRVLTLQHAVPAAAPPSANGANGPRSEALPEPAAEDGAKPPEDAVKNHDNKGE